MEYPCIKDESRRKEYNVFFIRLEGTRFDLLYKHITAEEEKTSFEKVRSDKHDTSCNSDV